MSPREREAGRTCLGCRRQRPRAELIRVVRMPDGSACFDLEGRLPGRGGWMCPTPACLEALNAGALGHVLRAPVTLPTPPLRRQLLMQALTRRVENLLSMCRRVRGVLFGESGARAALAGGRARLVLLAADLSADAVASWRARAGETPLRLVPDSATLGALGGKPPVNVAAVTDAGLATALERPLGVLWEFWAVSCDNDELRSSTSTRRRQVAPRREEAEER